MVLGREINFPSLSYLKSPQPQNEQCRKAWKKPWRWLLYKSTCTPIFFVIAWAVQEADPEMEGNMEKIY
jgi:hypothetical protein